MKKENVTVRALVLSKPEVSAFKKKLEQTTAEVTQ